jgi:hypothetical protein
MPPSTMTRLVEAASAATSRTTSTSASINSPLLKDNDSTDGLLRMNDHHVSPEVEEVVPPTPTAMSNTLHPPCYSAAEFNVTRYVK